jgi:acetyl esterase/lipase
MSQDHISQKRAVYHIAGMERAIVRKDVVYRTTDAGPLTMDLYYPADTAAGRRLPAVVLVAGYNDIGYEKMLGVKFKEMGMSISWGQLIAASGLVAIAYTNREPVEDLDALLRHVRDNTASLGIDGDRIGVWGCSGNVPLALSALMQSQTPGPKGPGLHVEGDPKGPGLRAEQHRLRCAALLYGYMLDLDGATGVAEAAAMFRFTNPNAGRSLDDLREDLPLFIVRAGQEQFPHLNDSIDHFFAKALALNRPITLVNHAAGPHSFDLLDDSETSRRIVRQVLDFLTSQLTPAGS